MGRLVLAGDSRVRNLAADPFDHAPSFLQPSYLHRHQLPSDLVVYLLYHYRSSPVRPFQAHTVRLSRSHAEDTLLDLFHVDPESS